jgi:hypothetical protein
MTNVKNKASFRYIEESFKNKGLKTIREVKSKPFLEMTLSFMNGKMKTTNEENIATKTLPINNEGKRYYKNFKRKALSGMTLALFLNSMYSLSSKEE